MELRNLMEDEVIYAINRLLKDKKDICTCDKCKLDIAAIVLNNLKPKYVVTDKGELYGKVDTLDYQFDADLIKEIVKAVNIVGAEPRHE
ncbi:Late competence development protein ComFB [[Clostridium] ultunense Esp]|uniref:Late competence development protein ComFB n=1 Tax=[Clostridium] ultunense Esp TaxID=1288971 RepID=M1ZKT0_9FIRM|nr:late competence development ComFB family protein [Schnuerera ultunensis]CCQ95987.1 Late competence development protein ComFB [[Clostridium] ultunense Esp]SHD77175.1 Late competence development protein ComFB [[Clostridium] ultunense Esp]